MTITREQLELAALETASAKLRRLRLTDVGGRKEMPCATVKSVLQRGLGGLYDDAAVTYILKHGLRYYMEATAAAEQQLAKEKKE